MKRIITTSLLALALTSSLAFADDMKMKEEMMKCDTNKDGMISKEESMKHNEEMFKMMDKNSDGMLDASEQKMMMDHMKMMMKDDGMKDGSMMKKGM